MRALGKTALAVGRARCKCAKRVQKTSFGFDDQWVTRAIAGRTAGAFDRLRPLNLSGTVARSSILSGAAPCILSGLPGGPLICGAACSPIFSGLAMRFRVAAVAESSDGLVLGHAECAGIVGRPSGHDLKGRVDLGQTRIRRIPIPGHLVRVIGPHQSLPRRPDLGGI
mgnify:CR=1 FL=1